jgi:hypothetical protein
VFFLPYLLDTKRILGVATLLPHCIHVGLNVSEARAQKIEEVNTSGERLHRIGETPASIY